MKGVTITYHSTTQDGNQLNLTVDNDDEVQVLDARTIGGTETRWQFLVKSESGNTTRAVGDGK